jgi:hypothetical protein
LKGTTMLPVVNIEYAQLPRFMILPVRCWKWNRFIQQREHIEFPKKTIVKFKNSRLGGVS